MSSFPRYVFEVLFLAACKLPRSDASQVQLQPSSGFQHILRAPQKSSLYLSVDYVSPKTSPALEVVDFHLNSSKLSDFCMYRELNEKLNYLPINVNMSTGCQAI